MDPVETLIDAMDSMAIDDHVPTLAPTSASLFKKELKRRMAHGTKVAQRIQKENVDADFDHVAYREEVVRRFEKALGSRSKAVNMEKGVFNWTVGFCRDICTPRAWDNPVFKKKYRFKVRDVLFNITNTHNQEFVQNVCSGHVKSSKVAFMSSYDIHPSLVKPIFDKLEQRNLRFLMDQKELHETKGMFTCEQCHSKSTTFFSLQTRGADEPMTNFVRCISCNARWTC